MPASDLCRDCGNHADAHDRRAEDGACPGGASLVSDLVARASVADLLDALAVKGKAEDARPIVDSPRAAMVALADIARKRKEYFVALYLDACHRVMFREVVSIGTLTASLVHPREVFAPALTRGAAALIVAHNHPSGDPEPSREDRETTRRLVECGRILGIPILDHVIIGTRGYFSFRERGLIDNT